MPKETPPPALARHPSSPLPTPVQMSAFLILVSALCCADDVRLGARAQHPRRHHTANTRAQVAHPQVPIRVVIVQVLIVSVAGGAGQAEARALL
eukprot:scaffold1218_cov393-Prasinococcus_capsulatus_cf.AAC.1